MIAPILVVNGTPLRPQPFVTVVAGHDLVPVRAVVTAFGGTVAEDPATSRVTIVRDGRRSTVRIALRHANRVLADAAELGAALGAKVVDDPARHRIEFDAGSTYVPRPVPSVEVRYGKP